MPQDLQRVLSLLNGDLAWEYAALIQYIQHASMLTGPQYVAVIDELLQHAQQEHQHAVILSDLIQYLGGIPTVEVFQRQTSLDSVEMLRQDLQLEYDALNRYLLRIKQLEDLGALRLGPENQGHRRCRTGTRDRPGKGTGHPQAVNRENDIRGGIRGGTPAGPRLTGWSCRSWPPPGACRHPPSSPRSTRRQYNRPADSGSPGNTHVPTRPAPAPGSRPTG